MQYLGKSWHFVYYHVVRPELFKSEKVGNCKEDVQAKTSRTEEDEGSSEDDGLPPLEANTNRLRPHDLTSDEESDSETDTDSWATNC